MNCTLFLNLRIKFTLRATELFSIAKDGKRHVVYAFTLHRNPMRRSPLSQELPMKTRLAVISVAIAAICVALASVFSSPSLLSFHICGVSLAYLAFIACTAINIGLYARDIRAKKSLKQNSPNVPTISRRFPLPTASIALCDVGLAFAAETLMTGMFWAIRAWGAAWVWEPRLTGMLLMTAIFASWRLSCALLGSDTPNKIHYTAPLLVLGLPSMVFTHFATRLIGGIHPENIAQSGSTLGSWVSFTPIAIGHIAIGLAIFFLSCAAISRNNDE